MRTLLRWVWYCVLATLLGFALRGCGGNVPAPPPDAPAAPDAGYPYCQEIGCDEPSELYDATCAWSGALCVCDGKECLWRPEVPVRRLRPSGAGRRGREPS